MSRWSILAFGALLGFAEPALAQRMTEQFIPIGRSPGVSGTYSVIGTVEAVDRAARTVRIAGPQGAVTLAFTDSTRIWIDRSEQRQSALVGSITDLVVGRRIEAKYLGPDRRDAADWIKVAGAPPGQEIDAAVVSMLLATPALWQRVDRHPQRRESVRLEP